MILLGLILAGIAALLHLYIFAMESFLWTKEKTRATFGITSEEAEATKELAFNQGFYNLFLAIVSMLGIILVIVGPSTVGYTLVLTGSASMAGAGLVLLISSPAKASAALKQLILPLLAVLALSIGLIIAA